MKKSFGIIAGLATLAFIAMPGTPAGAEPVYSDDGTVATVKTYGDFDTALKNDKVTTIKLDGDIDATGKTDILHDVTIDGGGHTLSLTALPIGSPTSCRLIRLLPLSRT